MLSTLTRAAVALVLAGPACVGPRPPAYPWEGESPLPVIDVSGAPNGIVPLPDDAHPALRETFDRYTCLVAPNGRPIHFIAQAAVSDAKLVRAREVMRFYLTDAPGTRFGGDKRAVANAMADRRATLALFESQAASAAAGRGELPFVPLFWQDLYVDRSVVEGDGPYLRNDVHDDTLRDVFHLVHAAGIRFALPEYHAVLEDAARSAVRGRRWSTNTEQVFEGTVSYEYAAAVIEVFYGIWAHDPHGSGESFGGEYRWLDRESIEEHDRPGVEAIAMFLPEAFAFDATVEEAFEGTFSLAYDPASSYTHKSRYLRDARLSGEGDAGLVGNALDNTLAGNAGDNAIDGGEGHDAVVFRGARSDYDLLAYLGGGDPLTVVDHVDGRDGTVELVNVECLHFGDGVEPLDGPCRGRRELALVAPAGEWDDAVPEPPGTDLGDHMRWVVEELLLLFDTDGDEALAEAEVERDFLLLVGLADVDADGRADREELAGAVEAAFVQGVPAGGSAGRDEAELDVQLVFARYDLDEDGRLVPSELPSELIDGFDAVDADGDGAITPPELLPTFVEPR